MKIIAQYRRVAENAGLDFEELEKQQKSNYMLKSLEEGYYYYYYHYYYYFTFNIKNSHK